MLALLNLPLVCKNNSLSPGLRNPQIYHLINMADYCSWKDRKRYINMAWSFYIILLRSIEMSGWRGFHNFFVKWLFSYNFLHKILNFSSQVDHYVSLIQTEPVFIVWDQCILYGINVKQRQSILVFVRWHHQWHHQMAIMMSFYWIKLMIWFMIECMMMVQSPSPGQAQKFWFGKCTQKCECIQPEKILITFPTTSHNISESQLLADLFRHFCSCLHAWSFFMLLLLSADLFQN